MRLLPMILVFAHTMVVPSWALVLGNPASVESSSALIQQWQEKLDTRAIVRIHTPFGATASGILLKGGTHVLTAAHVANCIRPGQIHQGLVDFPNADGQRRHWKSVVLHPAGTTAALQQIWDAALIELDQAIPDTELPGLVVSTKALQPGQLVALTGFGERGSGTLGVVEANGVFRLGFNHLDSQLSASRCPELRLAEGNWPLWLHDFDSAARNLLLEGGPWSSRGAGPEGGEMGVVDSPAVTGCSSNLVRPVGRILACFFLVIRGNKFVRYLK